MRVLFHHFLMKIFVLQQLMFMYQLLANSDYYDDDKKVAIPWLSELMSDLVSH